MHLKSVWPGAGMLAWAAAFLLVSPSTPRAGETFQRRVLLYEYSAVGGNTKARDYLRAALERLSEEKGFTLMVVRERQAFSTADLKSYSLVIFAHGSGEIIARGQAQDDFERYVREGGGLLAIHAAGTLIDHFPFLSEAVGVKYYRTTSSGNFRARVYMDPEAAEDSERQRIFQGLPRDAWLLDRWLTFQASPRGKTDTKVLLTLDDESYGDGFKMRDHPVVWTRTMGKGRTVYNGLGGEDVYTQADGYGEKLLWNLMEYAAPKSALDITEPGESFQGMRLSLADRRLSLLLPEGSYSLRVSDARGRVVQSASFQGPGSFQVPLKMRGMVVVRLEGPVGTLQKKLTIE